jgi:hypothetical protein
VDDEERQALRAEGLDPEDPAVIAAIDSATLQSHIQTMTAVVEAWRAAGIKAFLGWYDSALVRVLTAAGMNDAALERVELARQVADETGWRFYDAELLRLRAHTSDDPDARHADLRAAIGLLQTISN